MEIYTLMMCEYAMPNSQYPISRYPAFVSNAIFTAPIASQCLPALVHELQSDGYHAVDRVRRINTILIRRTSRKSGQQLHGLIDPLHGVEMETIFLHSLHNIFPQHQMLDVGNR